MKALGEDEKDDIIVAFMLAQERDKYVHELNLERYTAMLKDLEPGPWRDRIEKLRKETEQRLAEVNSIIKASEGQLPPQDRIGAAKRRLKAQAVP